MYELFSRNCQDFCRELSLYLAYPDFKADLIPLPEAGKGRAQSDNVLNAASFSSFSGRPSGRASAHASIDRARVSSDGVFNRKLEGY